MKNHITDKSRRLSLLALGKLEKNDRMRSFHESLVKKSYSENKKIRKFEKFGSSKFGDEIERKSLTQSLADALDGTLSDSEKLPFASSSQAKEASKFLQTQNQSQKDLLDFAKNHSQLNEQIQVEILDTLQNAYDETEITNSENPFYYENIFVQKAQQLSNEELLKNIDNYKTNLWQTATGKDNSANFVFYKNEYEKVVSTKSKHAKKGKEKDTVEITKKADHEVEILS